MARVNLHLSLYQESKLHDAAFDLGLDPDTLAGKLGRLWGHVADWAQLDGGEFRPLRGAMVARVMGLSGIEPLVTHGWLDEVGEDSYRVHQDEKHIGPLVREKLNARARMRRNRAKPEDVRRTFGEQFGERYANGSANTSESEGRKEDLHGLGRPTNQPGGEVITNPLSPSHGPHEAKAYDRRIQLFVRDIILTWEAEPDFKGKVGRRDRIEAWVRDVEGTDEWTKAKARISRYAKCKALWTERGDPYWLATYLETRIYNRPDLDDDARPSSGPSSPKEPILSLKHFVMLRMRGHLAHYDADSVAKFETQARASPQEVAALEAQLGGGVPQKETT